MMPVTRTVTLPVTGSDGITPPDVTIWASTALHGTYVGRQSTSGTVTLQLPDGTYTLMSAAAGYEPWTTQITVAAAMTVPVNLLPAGRISGVLSGTVGAAVTAFNTTTGASFTNFMLGTYTFSDLPLGDYVVAADPWDANLGKCGPSVWFGGTSYLTARRLHVTSASRSGQRTSPSAAPRTGRRPATSSARSPSRLPPLPMRPPASKSRPRTASSR